MLSVQEILAKAKSIKKDKDFLKRTHHVMKRKYGISFEEFKKLPIPTFFDLFDELKKDAEAEQRELDKVTRKKGHA